MPRRPRRATRNCGERQTHRSWLSSCRCVAPVDCPLLRDEGRAKSRKEQGRNECGWPFIGELCNKAKSVRLRPPGASFFGLVALAECYDFRWVDGIVVDLHFNDFAAFRSEERRVGKEWRASRSPWQE